MKLDPVNRLRRVSEALRARPTPEATRSTNKAP